MMRHGPLASGSEAARCSCTGRALQNQMGCCVSDSPLRSCPERGPHYTATTVPRFAWGGVRVIAGL